MYKNPARFERDFFDFNKVGEACCQTTLARTTLIVDSHRDNSCYNS